MVFHATSNGGCSWTTSLLTAPSFRRDPRLSRKRAAQLLLLRGERSELLPPGCRAGGDDALRLRPHVARLVHEQQRQRRQIAHGADEAQVASADVLEREPPERGSEREAEVHERRVQGER